MKQSSPSALRNREPILAELRKVLPSRGAVLEIASGSGEHVVHFASALPSLTFQPSDVDAAARASVDAWRTESGLTNLRTAVALDVEDSNWPVTVADAVICINMIHISPWTATEGLVSGAARLLPAGGILFLYGPYHRAGVDTSTSNSTFDADLRARNPAWGLRNLEDVVDLARTCGFAHAATHDMPANNLSVIFRRNHPRG